ncbi:type I polyketide synthase [Dactylosporangium sp. NPDC000521]|uniref:type I polyketide synthase n=1 Tax=Dactylosporangium sp. NPDC000521 TaxID=3363975 RepID=UPI0036743DD9
MNTSAEPIAIIGMGCRLPGGVDAPEALWRLLDEGGDAIGAVPDGRWDAYAARGPAYAAAVARAVRAGGYLSDIAGFDAEFFGISPREAELMDPQQRVTLEVAWEALEHAGIAPATLAGTDGSVFMGVCCDDYGRRLLEDLPNVEAWTGIGASMCAVANRVSYALDLRGPSITVDTACSASLVAVHQACQSLRAGETSLAVAGGVMLVASPSFALILEAAGALSPDGTSKAFDAAANGYVRSEGCAVLVLKRHSDAIRDGDQVLALVRGGAVCQDGRTNGIMAPSETAQAHLMRQAARNAGVPLESIGYIEAHGTGTGVGDPIEVAALAATVGAGRAADEPCLIGSVKSNLGHLEAASGVVGVMKLVLALGHDMIPATLSRTGLNPRIPWDGSGLRVTRDRTPWPRMPGRPRRAGVGNYGYGGTLAHLIIEEAPARTPDVPAPDGVGLFPLSAATEAGLRATADRLAGWVAAGGDPLDAVGASLGRIRTGLPVRAAVVAADRDQLAARLAALAADRPADGVVSGRVPRGDGAVRDRAARGDGVVRGRAARGGDTPVVWVFSGHGAQWAGMGRELLATEPALARTFAEVDAVYREELGVSPRQVIADGDLDEVGRVQALTFLMQVGLARVWMSYGLRPAAVIGHSVGEIAAAVVSGRLDLTDAARLVCRRSRLLRQAAGQGAMALAGLPFAEAAARLAGAPDVVAAISASPSSTVLSGDAAALDRVLAAWGAEGLTARRVNTDVAFHSPHMDPLVPGLLAVGTAPRTGTVPAYGTTLSDPRADPPRDAAYWAANLRNPVRFAEAVQAAADDGHRVFLEVSTHPVVAHSILQTAGGATVLPTLRRDQPERATMLATLGALYCHGVPVDWSRVFPGSGRAELPPMAWQHRRFWAEPEPAAAEPVQQHDVTAHTVLGRRTVVQGTAPVWLWQTRLDEGSRPYPGGHRVLGTEVLPAAVVLTTLLAAAGTPALTDVTLRVPLTLGAPRDVQVVRQDGAVHLSSRLAGGSDSAWATHANATADEKPAPGDGVVGCGRLELPPAGAAVVPAERVMDLLREIGVVGIGFPWVVREVRRTGGRVVARIAADPDGLMPARTWASLFDAGLSAAPVTFPAPARLRMPGRLRHVAVAGPPPDEALVGVDLVAVEPSGDTVVDVRVAGLDGVVLAELLGVRFGVVSHAEVPAGEAGAPEVAGWPELTGDDLAEQVEAAVREVVAHELRLDPATIDAHRPLSELGVDSLLSESIRQRLHRRARFALPSSLLWDRPSVAAIAAYLAERVTADRAADRAVDRAAAGAATDAVTDVAADVVDVADHRVAGGVR